MLLTVVLEKHFFEVYRKIIFLLGIFYYFCLSRMTVWMFLTDIQNLWYVCFYEHNLFLGFFSSTKSMLCLTLSTKCILCLILSPNDMLCIILFTDDVTPPSLRWLGSPPTLTNGSISLSWTTDEAVTSLCTVHSPVKDKNESCNNEWVGTDLRNGEYSLTVKMVDGSGNQAQTIHFWNNSMKTCVFLLNSSPGI